MDSISNARCVFAYSDVLVRFSAALSFQLCINERVGDSDNETPGRVTFLLPFVEVPDGGFKVRLPKDILPDLDSGPLLDRVCFSLSRFLSRALILSFKGQGQHCAVNRGGN